MTSPRVLPLIDTTVYPPSWNERMVPGEYAVLYSHRSKEAAAGGETCLVFDSLDDAVAHARAAVAEDTALQCRIYDHHGLGGAPAATVEGSTYKGESAISSGFRRVGGAALLVGGVALVAVDWASDFRLTWPATLGARMAPVGLILLVTEAAILLTARRGKAQPDSVLAETENRK